MTGSTNHSKWNTETHLCPSFGCRDQEQGISVSGFSSQNMRGLLWAAFLVAIALVDARPSKSKFLRNLPTVTFLASYEVIAGASFYVTSEREVTILRFLRWENCVMSLKTWRGKREREGARSQFVLDVSPDSLWWPVLGYKKCVQACRPVNFWKHGRCKLCRVCARGTSCGCARKWLLTPDKRDPGTFRKNWSLELHRELIFPPPENSLVSRICFFCAHETALLSSSISSNYVSLGTRENTSLRRLSTESSNLQGHTSN